MTLTVNITVDIVDGALRKTERKKSFESSVLFTVVKQVHGKLVPVIV